MKPIAAVFFALVLALVAAPWPATAQERAPEAGLGAEVATRDQLIAAQENLLNAYRCLHQADTDAVAGRCDGTDPAVTVEPGPPPPAPDQADVDTRDALVVAQEALLNAYRCRFNVDTQLVLDGCGSTTTTPAAAEPQTITISAGENHSCAIRTDRTIACWGEERGGKLDAPDGQFTAISAGDWHSCAIRTDRTIACWGNNDYVQTDIPSGKFTATAASFAHSCSIRADRTVVCWWGNDYEHGWLNDHGQADALSGEFNAIAANAAHSCGIRKDGTVACWGYNRDGRSDAPDGEFNAIAAGGKHTCGIRTNRTIACWGNNEHGQTNPPEGEFGP